MNARAITKALGGKWAGSYGLARCPVHADRTPSLKVKDDARKSDGIDVICFADCDWRDIKDTLKRQGLLPEFVPSAPPKLAKLTVVAPSVDDDTDQRLERALRLWDASKPLTPDTLGWKYFTEHRGLDIGKLKLDHALLYHPGFDAVIALMTDPVTNEPRGIHRTFLNPNGSKRERKMLGRQGMVRVSPDEDVTYGLGLTEGIEDALSYLVVGWAPVWAATSAGAMAKFPVLGGVEALTIFPDKDENEVGQSAAIKCADRWALAGREVFIR
jgi:hypothetical protein